MLSGHEQIGHHTRPMRGNVADRTRRLKELAAQMEQDEKKLSKPDFVAKVPPDVLKKTQARHEECRAEHDKLAAELRRLKEMPGGAA